MSCVNALSWEQYTLNSYSSVVVAVLVPTGIGFGGVDGPAVSNSGEIVSVQRQFETAGPSDTSVNKAGYGTLSGDFQNRSLR